MSHATRPSGCRRPTLFASLVTACRYVVAIALVATPLVLPNLAHAALSCVNDAQGPDDEPGQKDLTRFCKSDAGSCGMGSDFQITWNFDDVGWTGTNTGDACAFFDNDGNGNADYAVCASFSDGTTGNPPTLSAVTCYTCDNTRPSKCPSAVATPCSSTCAGGSDTDPFSGDVNHTQCGPSNSDCLTADAQATCCIEDNFGTLLDVCSFPSSNPNSDFSDCIITTVCKQVGDTACDDGNDCTTDTCDTVADVGRHTDATEGTSCGSSDDTGCDAPDTCDGSGTCVDRVDDAGTVCRSSAGVCDAAETCDGTSKTCPADAFASSSTVCRSAAGDCDVAENCTGSSADCPADDFVSSSTVCRSSAGVCDVAETCTGSTADCPADDFVSSATVCRSSAGVCDVAE